MKLRVSLALLCGGWLLAGNVMAQCRLTVSLGAATRGPEIPSDFVGLSFEITNLLPDTKGQRIFSGDNQPLIALFREIGIKNLRVGGGTAEPKSGNPANDAKIKVPGPADIDALFAFAAAADVKVIYTLRLLKGDKEQAAAIASYIATHYGARLQTFEIGNEPDWHAYHSFPGRPLDPDIVETTPGVPGSAYPSFLAKWREFAAAIVRAVPDARFGGPDTGSNYPVPGTKDTDYNGRSWTHQFAADERDSGRLVAAYHHDYTGQSATGVSIPQAVDAMLSAAWPAQNYPALFNHVLAPVQALGLPYRMTECNDYTGGVDGASNAFASALWALDYLHWHAAHGAIGMNFHNKRWIFTDTIYLAPDGVFKINPKAYGLKAFSLGSHGRVAPVTVDNGDSVNLTAYAVTDASARFVTLINKEHDRGAREAVVTIVPPTPFTKAESIALLAPHGDVRAKSGVTLGGAEITNQTAWSGHWSSIRVAADGRCTITVPAASALVVKLTP
jgi:hypothetical protein